MILSKKLENVPKPIFFAHILKKSYSKINLRIFFCIFGDFQNFQISRFQIPENLEILWKWLFFTKCNILGIFPTRYESLSLVFISEYLNSHFAGISRFQKIWKWPFLTNYNILAIFSTQFDFSFGIFEFSFSQYVAIVKNSNFQMFWSLEPGHSRKMRIQKF